MKLSDLIDAEGVAASVLPWQTASAPDILADIRAARKRIASLPPPPSVVHVSSLDALPIRHGIDELNLGTLGQFCGLQIAICGGCDEDVPHFGPTTLHKFLPKG